MYLVYKCIAGVINIKYLVHKIISVVAYRQDVIGKCCRVSRQELVQTVELWPGLGHCWPYREVMHRLHSHRSENRRLDIFYFNSRTFYTKWPNPLQSFFWAFRAWDSSIKLITLIYDLLFEIALGYESNEWVRFPVLDCFLLVVVLLNL